MPLCMCGDQNLRDYNPAEKNGHCSTRDPMVDLDFRACLMVLLFPGCWHGLYNSFILKGGSAPGAGEKEDSGKET